jgi:hypothetical protein
MLNQCINPPVSIATQLSVFVKGHVSLSPNPFSFSKSRDGISIQLIKFFAQWFRCHVFRLFSPCSCSHTFADLRAVCSGWPELPEGASDGNTGIAEYVMGLALRAIDSAYRGAA